MIPLIKITKQVRIEFARWNLRQDKARREYYLHPITLPNGKVERHCSVCGDSVVAMVKTRRPRCQRCKAREWAREKARQKKLEATGSG